MIESLTREARAELRTRYRDDKLFRAWSHPLLELQREMGQPAPEEIWYLTERLHVRLRDLGDGAPYEIEYVFREIYESLTGNDMTKGESIFTAAVVSTVLLSQLCASKPKGKGDNPNHPCCRALARILTEDDFLPVVGNLMEMLGAEKTDLAGQKLVVPITDYLNEAESDKHLSASTVQEIDRIVDVIWKKCCGAKGMLKVSEESFRELWHKLLSMPDMLTRVKEVSPRKNEWEMNMKMVANVLGIMMNHLKMEFNQSRACDLLGIQKARSYMGNHAAFGTSNTVFSKEEYEKVVALVKEL